MPPNAAELREPYGCFSGSSNSLWTTKAASLDLLLHYKAVHCNSAYAIFNTTPVPKFMCQASADVSAARKWTAHVHRLVL